jgi:hypothetical protein
MPIYHISYHGYRRILSPKEMEKNLAMLTAGLEAAPHIDDFFVGRYLGNPRDGYHDAACVKFKNLDAYRIHLRSPHGPDQAAHLRENVARVWAFDIITADEPADTAEKIIQLYKERWELFPDVAKALREDVETRVPYL